MCLCCVKKNYIKFATSSFVCLTLIRQTFQVMKILKVPKKITVLSDVI